MKCNRYRQQLEEWLDGGLSVAARSALESHLGACPACARYFDQRRAMGAALKKTFSAWAADLHFQPRSLDRRPLAELPARRRPGSVFEPRALAALAAALLIALLFLFQPWSRPRPSAPGGTTPIAEITVSDSLNITSEAYITGCSAGVCYSIEMQISAVTINDPS